MNKITIKFNEIFSKGKKLLIDNKKNRFILLFLVVITCIALSGFFLGRKTTDKSYIIKNFEKAILENDYKTALKFLTLKDDFLELNKDTAAPFFAYLNGTEGRKSQLISYLKTPEALEEGNTIVLKKVNKGLYTKWVLELQPVFLDFTSNYKDTEIYLDDNLYDISKSPDYNITLGPLVPGIYNLKVLLNNSYGRSEENSQIQLIKGLTSFSLTPPSGYVTALSNFSDSKVFINGKDSGLTVSDFQDIGPIPLKANITLYGEKAFPWGIIKSEEKTIVDTSNIRLDLNPLNDELRSSLEEKYKEFYESLFTALNQKNLNLIEEPSRKAAEVIYNKYKSSALIIKESYEMTDIQWEQNAISLKTEDSTYKANAIVNLSYNKNISLAGFPISLRPKVLSFQTILSYSEKDNAWYVAEINDLTK